MTKRTLAFVFAALLFAPAAADESVEVEPPNEFSSVASYESFDDGTASWREVYVQYKRRMGWGSLLGRVNLAERFDRNDEQVEIDAYPKLAKKTYLYLNVGRSPGDVFPEWRYGAEYFRGFGDGWEGSVGARHLQFSSSSVTLYTGTIGKYHGDYFVWVRPFVSDKTGGTSVSGTVFVRRYFDHAETYVTVSAGAGSSPDEKQLVGQDLGRNDSWKVRVDGQKRLGGKWTVKGNGGYRSEEFGGGRQRDSWRVGFGFERKF